MSTMKKAIAITFAVIGGVLAVLAIIGGILSATGYKPPAGPPSAAVTPAANPVTTHAPAAHTPPAAPPATAPAAVTLARQVISVMFTVTGTGAPSITYGTDSDNLSPGGTLGPLGDGNALPWHGAMTYSKSALYYSVSAQLEGAGDIRCAITLRVTRYYSDGTRASRSKVVASGHASGGYNICSAQVNG